MKANETIDKRKTLILRIWDDGDPSVGIWSSEMSIDLGIQPNEFTEYERKEFIKDAEALFRRWDLLQGRTQIYFNDECPECRAKRCNCSCYVLEEDG